MFCQQQAAKRRAALTLGLRVLAAGGGGCVSQPLAVSHSSLFRRIAAASAAIVNLAGRDRKCYMQSVSGVVSWW